MKQDFLSLDNEGYIGGNVNTKATYLIKKGGRYNLQEVCKKSPKKAFFANLERRIFEIFPSENKLPTSAKKLWVQYWVPHIIGVK